jgi:hypothetical protein
MNSNNIAALARLNHQRRVLPNSQPLAVSPGEDSLSGGVAGASHGLGSLGNMPAYARSNAASRASISGVVLDFDRRKNIDALYYMNKTANGRANFTLLKAVSASLTQISDLPGKLQADRFVNAPPI